MAPIAIDKLEELLAICCQHNASDLILVAGCPPCMYRNEILERLSFGPLPAAQIERLITPLLSEEQKRCLNKHQDLDFALTTSCGRCRVNLHYQRETLAAAIRIIKAEVPELESLRLPDIVHEFAQLPQGLVLVTGAVGQGKTTTLAAMVEHVNKNFCKHVITLEDPVEYIIHSRKSIVEQREIGRDAPSFGSALRHILRQKPSVILVGEMRDHTTMATAITAAETGQLVLATLHTMSAVQAVERIVDSFEGSQQQQIRIQLANTLQAVVSQVLFRGEQELGMVPACEILVATTAVRRAIRDNETYLIQGMIQTGAKFGMKTMGQAVSELIAQGQLRKDEAMARLAAIDIAGQSSDPAVTWNAPIPPPSAKAANTRS